MVEKIRKTETSSEIGKQTRAGTGLDCTEGLETKRVLQEGVASVAGAARFAIAAVSDMLNGKLTAQEATVVTTASGRILKAAELYLKHARGNNPQLLIPEMK